MKLFNRTAAVTVDDVRAEDLRLAFSTRKTWTSEPNASEITIYNPGPDLMSAVKKGARVVLEVGWNWQMSILAKGRILFHQTKRQGPDKTLVLNVSDGGHELSRAFTSAAYSGTVEIRKVLKSLASDLQVGVGNALKRVEEGDVKGAVDQWMNGMALHGKTGDALDRVLGLAGLDWSIQDGELLVMKAGEFTNDPVVIVNRETGLIGSPETQVSIAGNVVVPMRMTSFTSLLNPLIRPGRRVSLDGEHIKGLLAVAFVTHTGDTRGDEWSTKVEGWL